MAGGVAIAHHSMTIGGLAFLLRHPAAAQPAGSAAIQIVPTIVMGHQSLMALSTCYPWKQWNLTRGARILSFAARFDSKELHFRYGQPAVLNGVDLDDST